jgi:hypothetical protein
MNKGVTKEDSPFKWILEVRESWRKIKLIGLYESQNERVGITHRERFRRKGIKITGIQNRLELMFLSPGSKDEKMSIIIITWIFPLKALKTFSLG